MGYEGVERRVDELRRARVSRLTREELERELLTDQMTGLPNRRAFEDWCRLTRPALVAIIDVDALKWVNDHWGHAAGDELLRALSVSAETLGIGLFRVGGDEFAVTFEQHEHAHRLLARLQRCLRTVPFLTPEGFATGARFSFGVGSTTEAADAQLRAMKTARTSLGIRPPRGERPTGLAVRSAATGTTGTAGTESGWIGGAL